MRELETDYLVVGAGATGMAFVDSLIAGTEARVVMVDRRHAPGGHWLDAYPFVRLHQPSANYGVNSTRLGQDRIDRNGPNAGFYERATGAEICGYFARVLDDVLAASGQVQFLGNTDYRGADGDEHQLVSLLTGETTIVKVRRTLVDATYVESSVPSRHARPFTADEGVRVVAPNGLVDLHDPARGFTVLGAGKTAMDTCNWLLDAGIDPDGIEWFRPTDPWLFDRTSMQPLELVANYMDFQAHWVEAAAQATDGADFAHRLEAAGDFLRIDPETEPVTFRGATISTGELESLRSIERVVPGRRVHHIETNRLVTDGGDVATRPGRVYVDCTAPGVRPTVERPIFDNGVITLQYVTIGIVPWSAAIIGTVEAMDVDLDTKNHLCPPLAFSGRSRDILELAHVGMTGLMRRSADPHLRAWDAACRFNPAAAAPHSADPRIPAAFASLGAHIGAAMANLARLAGEPAGV